MTALEQRCMDLLAAGPLTAVEIAGELHVSESTAGGILARLKTDGAVVVHTVRMRGYGAGSGRGRNVYALAPSWAATISVEE